MKTIVKSIVCALALSSTVAFASGENNATTTNTNTKFEVGAFITTDNSVRVAVKKNVADLVTVSLRAANGDEVYFANIGKKEMGFAAKLNLKELGEGAYKLEVKSGKEKYTKELNIKNEKVEVERKITMQ